MRKSLKTSIIWMLIFFTGLLLSSSLPVSEGNKQTKIESINLNRPEIVGYFQGTFQHGDCLYTITFSVVFYIDFAGRLLRAEFGDHYTVNVNCGGTMYAYARGRSDVQFTVSHGDITDVEFSDTVPPKLDELYSDLTFKQDFLQLINSNRP